MPDYTFSAVAPAGVSINGIPTTDFRLAHSKGSTIRFESESVVSMTVTDDDGDLSGDSPNERSSDGSQQTTEILGTTENVYIDYSYTVSDTSGDSYTVYVVDVRDSPNASLEDNRAVTYFAFDRSNPPPLDTDLRIERFSHVKSEPYATFVCFTSGTLILTPTGEIPVEDIAPGTMLVTRDGDAPVRWAGRRHVGALDILLSPRLLPVRIAKGSLAPGRPRVDTLVSRQHRIMLTGSMLELATGHHEALAPAHAIGPTEPPGSVTLPLVYHHLLLDRHHVIRANGMWAESLLLAPISERILADQCDALLYPGAAALGIRHDRAARPILRASEARAITAGEQALV